MSGAGAGAGAEAGAAGRIHGGGFLERMARDSARRVWEARAAEPLADLVARARDGEQPPAYRPDSFEVWAEFKSSSPSEGIFDRRDLDRRVDAYQEGGAAVLSVLTERSEFGGSLADLQGAARRAAVPVLRKDFLVDPYQVWEALAAGASGVLLIARILTDEVLNRMLDAAAEAGLFVLLEAFEQEELDRAAGAARVAGAAGRTPVVLGVNCRDLDTLRVDPARFADYRLPGRPRPGGIAEGSVAEARTTAAPGLRVVAESGIEDPAGAARVAALGYGAVLVGSALMRSGRPVESVRELLEAGRAACRSG